MFVDDLPESWENPGKAPTSEETVDTAVDAVDESELISESSADICVEELCAEE